MAIDNLDSSTRADAKETSKGSDPQAKGIFVRISPAAKRTLEGAAASGQITYAEVVEKLLRYYESQEPDIQEKILLGVGINPQKELEDLLARLNRAQHAFENKRFYYAATIYRDLAQQLRKHDRSKELLEYCNYRRGHCWIRLSYDLRLAALDLMQEDQQAKTKPESLYLTALRALDIAMKHLKRVKDDGDSLTRLIKHYNMACCYSLKAQYVVESKLEPGSKARATLCDAEDNSEKILTAWGIIGETLRKPDGEFDDADIQAKKALNELEEIYSAFETSGESAKRLNLTSEQSWCVEMADRDSDLIFLRTDRRWKPIFDAWVTAARQSDKSILNPIKDLLESEEDED